MADGYGGFRLKYDSAVSERILDMESGNPYVSLYRGMETVRSTKDVKQRVCFKKPISEKKKNRDLFFQFFYLFFHFPISFFIVLLLVRCKFVQKP